MTLAKLALRLCSIPLDLTQCGWFQRVNPEDRTRPNGVADMLAIRSDNSGGRGLVAVRDPLVNFEQSWCSNACEVNPQMHMHGLLACCLDVQHYLLFCFLVVIRTELVIELMRASVHWFTGSTIENWNSCRPYKLNRWRIKYFDPHIQVHAYTRGGYVIV